MTQTEIQYFKESDWDKLFHFYKTVWRSPRMAQSDSWFKWFNWQYIQNPHNSEEFVPVMLVFDKKKIIGQLALIPTYIWINGKAFKCAWGHDQYVSVKHRRKKIGLHTYQKWIDDYQVCLGTGQSPKGYHLQKKLGWTFLGHVHQYEKLFYNKDYLKQSYKESIKLFSKRLFAVFYSFSKKSLVKNRNNYRIENKKKFDERVDELEIHKASIF